MASVSEDTSNGEKNNNGSSLTTYEKIMGRKPEVKISSSDSLLENEKQVSEAALSSRLATFRKWLTDEANVVVHPAVCIVNGEATDGTKNAPVLVFDRPAAENEQLSGNAGGNANPIAERAGTVDWGGDQALYDRTLGCQVRAVREIKKDEVMMTMPRSAMITPDLVASSDAGRAILACCRAANGSDNGEKGFWDTFENTTICESKFSPKVAGNTGPQLLVKILQERKKVESALNKRIQEQAVKKEKGAEKLDYSLCDPGTLSTRAPLMAFLIHQRFSDAPRPPVESQGSSRPPGSPETFAPYARTLPSSISTPLCWKRSELALLAGTIPGTGVLQEVAVRTLQLASEFIALLESGILERFSRTFSGGLLTWDRWVWAAAVVSSRALPATCYIDAGKSNASEFIPADPLEFQSPAEIWNELGVMVPLLDMLNHEIEAHQVTWQPCVPKSAEQLLDDILLVDDDTDPSQSEAAHPPRAIFHRKIRKGSEIYTCYGNLTNHNLILQYGFAQLSNPTDEVKLGWGLMDCVGYLDEPEHYFSPVAVDDAVRKFLVFETSEAEEVQTWWTADRLNLLEKEAFSAVEDEFMSDLKNGKRMTACASCDGSYHPILLAALVVATMPKIELQKHLTSNREKIKVSRRHQQVLRSYLAFLFSRKLEKLMQNISSGLKDHFGTGKLWTSASKGGLRYKPDKDGSDEFIGWQSFFDSHAYNATFVVEKHYYAMGSDSCVLALYDGQLRALQLSLDGVCDDATFQSGILQQLQDLGFGVAGDGDESPKHSPKQANGGSPSSEKKSPRSRRRNRKKKTTVTGNTTDRPTALKLHVGNLAFTTTPSDMYDYFSSLYGKDNILECHIPLERDKGRSRGFGFVTMPEFIAQRVLDSGKKHEIGGRLLKVSKSNSAGTSSAGRARPDSAAGSDRCSKCGYRPKYCMCATPSASGSDIPQDPSTRSYEMQPGYRRDDRDFGYYGSGDRYRDDRYYRDAPPYDHDREDRGRDRYGREREYERGGSYAGRYEDSRSRSYDRADDRYYDQNRRDRGSERSRERSGDRSSERRSSSRRWDNEDSRESRREGDRSNSRKRSRSRESRRRKKKRTHSRSTTPPDGEK